MRIAVLQCVQTLEVGVVCFGAFKPPHVLSWLIRRLMCPAVSVTSPPLLQAASGVLDDVDPYASAERLMGPEVMTLVRKVRTLQVRGSAVAPPAHP